MEEKPKLFREKTVEALQSPESLNDYLKVTSPATWLVLLAVALVLVGTLVWGVLGSIDTRVSAAVVSQGGQLYLLAPYDRMEAVMANNAVTVEEQTLTLSGAVTDALSVTEETDVSIRLAGGFALGDVLAVAPLEGSLPEGVYPAKALTEKLKPISLLLK